MSESGSANTEIQKEIEKRSDPEKVLERIKELSESAKNRFRNGLLYLGLSGAQMGGVLFMTEMNRQVTGSPEEELVLGVLTAAATLSGLNTARIGINEIAGSRDDANRASTLDGALTNHLLNKYNIKQ